MTRTLPRRYINDRGSADGGFGHVLFCTDSHLSRTVAVKFMQRPADSGRLRDEVNALLKLRSKHVVQVFDLVDDGAEIGIVEEFIEGEDLWDSKFPRTSQQAYLKTLWQVASGLADIHTARIIHRDIKPNNIKLDGEGVVKIYDFGLARSEGPKAKTKGFLGTPGFAAPELDQPNTVQFSRAIDTYAFGATAFFLAIGRLPDSLSQLVPTPPPQSILTDPPLSVPEEIARLLIACLNHDPSGRPAMTLIRDELAKHLLKDRHQALVVFSGKASYLNSSKRNIRLSYGEIGTVEIHYDGLRFIVRASEGEVYTNNKQLRVGEDIPDSCVVALGGPQRLSRNRAFITFDVSHPEVTI